MTLQDGLRLEIAWTAAPDSALPDWTDVSSYVDLARSGFTRTYGRQNEYGSVQTGTATLVLNNSDGRFTPGNSRSPLYPNVVDGKRLRVTYRNPAVGGNLLSSSTSTASADFEDGTVGQWFGSSGAAVANSTTHVDTGTKAMLVTWPTSSVSDARVSVSGFVIGRSYTATVRVWVPVGVPDMALQLGATVGSVVSTKGAFATLTVTWVATATFATLAVVPQAATTAAQQTWIDTARVDETNAPAAFTVAVMPISYRFTGYTSGWEASFADPATNTSDVTVTAQDRFSRLTTRRKLRNVVAEEILYDGPVAYYQLDEPDQSTSVADSSVNLGPPLTIKQWGSGGSITFGNATGSAYDNQGAPTWAWVNSSNGKSLQGKLPDPPATVTAVHLRVCYSTTQTQEMAGLTVYDTLGNFITLFKMGSGSEVGVLFANNVTQTNYHGVLFATVSGPQNGLTHDLSASYSLSGGTVTVTLYFDGSQVATTTFAATSLPRFSNVMIGGTVHWSAPEPWDAGQLSHAAVFLNTIPSGLRVAQHSSGVLTGFGGELVHDRLARISRWVAVDPTEQAFDITTTHALSFIDTSGKDALAAMQDVVDTEGGRLFVSGSGLLAFNSRDRVWNVTPAPVYVDAELLGDSPRFILDNSDLVNDLEGQRPNGPVVRVIDSASQSVRGIIGGSGTQNVYVQTDQEVADWVNYRVATKSTPVVRMADGSAIDVIPLAASAFELLPARTNSLSNPSFEGVTSPWTALRGTVANVTDGPGAVQGRMVGRYTSTDGTTAAGNVLQSEEITVLGGIVSCSASAYIRPTSTSAVGGFRVDIQKYDGAHVSLGIVQGSVVTTPAGEFTRVTIQAPLTGSPTFIRLNITPVNAVAVSDTYDVDACCVDMGTLEVRPYIEGTVDPLVTQLLAADLGTRLRITGLPRQAPNGGADSIIEGWAEKWTANEVSFVFNTSDTRNTLPWILEDNVYGFIDNDYRITY